MIRKLLAVLIGLLAAVGLSLIALLIWRHQTSGPPSFVLEETMTVASLSQRARIPEQDLRDWNDLQGDRVQKGTAIRLGAPPTYSGLPTLPPRVDVVLDHILDLFMAAPTVIPSAPIEVHLRPGYFDANGVWVGASRAVLERREKQPVPVAQECVPEPLRVRGRLVVPAELTNDQINESLNEAIVYAAPCLPDTLRQEGKLRYELTVACTGLVTSAQLRSDGGYDPSLARCVLDVLKNTPFPAHAVAEGQTFDVPVLLSLGGPAAAP